MASKLPRLTTFYIDYLDHHDISRLIEEVSTCYALGTILRLSGSQDVDTRRAVAMILGFVGTYQANDTLGGFLHDSDRSVRLLAETSIKMVWPRDGSDEARETLCQIMRLIAKHDFQEAVRIANNLLEEFPLFAEARNQRAIALFALKQFEDALEDSAIVLDLNPFHFGAAIGMGHAYLQLHNPELATMSFQHALRINPNLETVRRHLDRILNERSF
ncbi:MAG: hypothetical protein ACRCUY_06495 [Thermoguttaceae bacterium]